MTSDDAEAARLYKLAADQGLTNAENRLGVMYDSGYGVTRDSAEASRLFERAAAKGNEDAKGFADLADVRALLDGCPGAKAFLADALHEARSPAPAATA